MNDNPYEVPIRAESIDPTLTEAGCNVGDLDQVGIEIPMNGIEAHAWQELRN